MSYFWLSKDTSVHKDWIYATGSQVYNLPSNFMFRLFWRKVLWSKLETLKWTVLWRSEISKRLLLGSIPTLLPSKKDNKPDISSEKGTLAQGKKEVTEAITLS